MTETATVLPLRWRPTVGFAARLRLIRLDYAERVGRRVSQTDMAGALGVAKGTYGSWEAGNARPADLEAFANAVYALTGADPAWLLGVADPTTTGPSDPSDLGIASRRCSVLSFPDRGRKAA